MKKIRHSFVLDPVNEAETLAYAKVKGYRTIGGMVSVAIEAMVARNPPTAKQQIRMDGLLGKEARPSFAVVRGGSSDKEVRSANG